MLFHNFDRVTELMYQQQVYQIQKTLLQDPNKKYHSLVLLHNFRLFLQYPADPLDMVLLSFLHLKCHISVSLWDIPVSMEQ